MIEEKTFPKENMKDSKALRGLSWYELPYHGTVRERKEQSKDLTAIIREFMSFDKTQYIEETLILETDVYKTFIAMTTSQAENKLADLELEYEMLYQSIDDSMRKNLEDQIAFLKGEYNL